MNILMLVTRRQKRGAEVSAANLSRQLIKSGHRIIWVGLYKPGVDELKLEDAENIDLPGNDASFLSIKKSRAIAKLISKYAIDIVQANGSDTLKHAVLAKMLNGRAKLVYRNISLVSFWLKNSTIKKIIYRWFSRRADHVVSVGKHSLKDFIETFQYDPAKISVINRGIPIQVHSREAAKMQIIEEFGLPADAKIIVWAGALSAEKNPTFMISVMQELTRLQPSAILIMAGKGPEEDLIKEMIAESSLKNVLLAGYRNQLGVLLAAADLLALSSRIEGVPGVVLEAAAQQTPAVAINVGGVGEAIDHNITGVLIGSHDEKSFAAKLNELLSDEPLRSKMGAAAAQRVKDQFDEHQKTAEFIALYESLLKRS
jgi:glycosyltransferase involved in cell wall biosynthesis